MLNLGQRWAEWRERRRRKKVLLSVIDTCSIDPQQIPQKAEKINVSTHALHQLVTYVTSHAHVDSAARSIDLKIVQPTTHIAVGEPKEDHTSTPQHPPTGNEEIEKWAKRLICLLVDQPTTDVETVRDFITHIAHAARMSDRKRLSMLDDVIRDALGIRHDVMRVVEPELVEIMRSVSSRTLSPQQSTVPSDTPPGLRQFPSFDLPEALRDSRCAIETILAALLNSSGVETKTEQTIDAGISGLKSSDPEADIACSSSDVLVVTRQHVQGVREELKTQADLTDEQIDNALRVIRRYALLPTKAIRWLLFQGDRSPLQTRLEGISTKKLDEAWTLLARLAIAALPALPETGAERQYSSTKGFTDTAPPESARRHSRIKVVAGATLPEPERRADDTVGLHKAHKVVAGATPREVLPQLYEIASDRATPPNLERFTADMAWRLAADDVAQERVIHGQPEVRFVELTGCVRRLLGSELAYISPGLFVQIAGELAQTGGTLSWQACLRLANSRSRRLRYLDATSGTDDQDAGSWNIELAMSRAFDTSWQIQYLLSEQSLSERIRSLFLSADLDGRIGILLCLVQFAVDARSSVFDVDQTEVQRVMRFRENEIWNRITSSETPRPGEESQDGSGGE